MMKILSNIRKLCSISEDETKLTTIKGNYEIIISDIYNGEVKRKSNNLININDLKYGVQIYNGVNQVMQVLFALDI